MVERIRVLELSDKLPTPRISLGNLIQQWARLEQKVPYRDWEDLISEVDKWRGDRNECAHGLVKSNPGDSTKPVEEFLSTARDCALHGKKLARDICDWTQRRKSQIRKEAQRQKFEYPE